VVPVNWYQKLISLSYFSGARFFWWQTPAPDRTCSISGQKPARKLNCDWSVWADENTACLSVNKNKAAFGLRRFSFWIFFYNLNAKTAAITSSFSKFSKSEYISVFFSASIIWWLSVSWFLAPDNWRQKIANVSSTWLSRVTLLTYLVTQSPVRTQQADQWRIKKHDIALQTDNVTRLYHCTNK